MNFFCIIIPSTRFFSLWSIKGPGGFALSVQDMGAEISDFFVFVPEN